MVSSRYSNIILLQEYKTRLFLEDNYSITLCAIIFLLQCADSFLFVYTFLPLRFAMALWAVVTRPLRHCLRYTYIVSIASISGGTLTHSGTLIYLVYRGGKVRAKNTGRYLSPAEVCDLLKGVVVLGCWAATWKVDTSMMYHLVKSQSVIKLYIFYNMLEVGDRLFSAFGQDTIDALLWTATEPRSRSRSARTQHLGTLPHLLFALTYVRILYNRLRSITINLRMKFRP